MTFERITKLTLILLVAVFFLVAIGAASAAGSSGSLNKQAVGITSSPDNHTQTIPVKIVPESALRFADVD